MAYRVSITTVLLVALISIPINSTAQSVTVFDASNDARQCHFAAQTASKFDFIARDKLKYCTIALEDRKLKRRDEAATYVNRGILQMILEHYQDALSDYQLAMELMPELPEAYVGRGNFYFIENEYVRAIADYSKALELDLSKDYLAHFNLGMAYEKINEYGTAEVNYRRALELLPEWDLAQRHLDRLLTNNKIRASIECAMAGTATAGVGCENN